MKNKRRERRSEAWRCMREIWSWAHGRLDYGRVVDGLSRRSWVVDVKQIWLIKKQEHKKILQSNEVHVHDVL